MNIFCVILYHYFKRRYKVSELTTNELTSQSHEDKWIGIIDSWKTSNLSQAEY